VSLHASGDSLALPLSPYAATDGAGLAERMYLDMYLSCVHTHVLSSYRNKDHGHVVNRKSGPSLVIYSRLLVLGIRFITTLELSVCLVIKQPRGPRQSPGWTEKSYIQAGESIPVTGLSI